MKRVLQVIPVIFAILIINFTLIRLAPGDPAIAMAGEWASWEYIDKVRHEWGLDKPLHEQFVMFLVGIMTNNLHSLTYNRPVFPLVLERMWVTIIFMFSSEAIAIGIGIAAGAYAAKKHGTKADRGISITMIGLISLPSFWVGLMLVLALGINLRWFPAAGLFPFEAETGVDYVLNLLWHCVLPVLTMVLWITPIFQRFTKASVMDVMNEEFITTARAKGLTENTVFFKHALRNATLPIITMAGLWFGYALTGAVLIESVFSWPGMGNFLYSAILNRDYPLLMGIYTITSAWMILSVLVTDIAYAYLDPRVVYK